MEDAYKEIQQIKSLRMKPRKDLSELEMVTLGVIKWNELYDQLLKPIENISLFSYYQSDQQQK